MKPDSFAKKNGNKRIFPDQVVENEDIEIILKMVSLCLEWFVFSSNRLTFMKRNSITPENERLLDFSLRSK
uniref:Uncharacterized protein n=1 Tax=Candidatus Kentrum sp. MB TaxID=2138164 RepID=A0A451BCQ1_9GAMM|nr:MAG: hypothetical protein BECKMB1821I_GA0114274_104015 [Candidatus Kentron sp. MB]VFK76061.1 MAG: hypothetical protein BECKMB1821H_GA0114242_104015 [Candidatus Kentron sp. MB]